MTTQLKKIAYWAYFVWLGLIVIHPLYISGTWFDQLVQQIIFILGPSLISRMIVWFAMLYGLALVLTAAGYVLVTLLFYAVPAKESSSTDKP